MRNIRALVGVAFLIASLLVIQPAPAFAQPVGQQSPAVGDYRPKGSGNVPQVNISTPSYPFGMGSRETKLVPYSLTEMGNVSGEITSRTLRFYTQYGVPLSNIIGPYPTSIPVTALQSSDWNELVYLPASVVDQARSMDEYAIVLKTTFQGKSSSGEDFTTQASLLLLLPPQSFSKDQPVDQAVGQPSSPLLTWGSSVGAIDYEYCFDTIDNNRCDTNWTGTYWPGTSDQNAGLQNLPSGTTFHWQVRANNTAGRTYADQGEWWSFTTACNTSLITVANIQDSGAGSLRQALADICPGGTINFAPSLAGQTITLNSTLLLYKDVKIDGSALASRITISGNNSVTVLEIEPGKVATLKGLMITKGRAPELEGGSAFSGGINNFGDLNLIDSVVSDSGSDFAVYGNGGGIYNSGDSTLNIVGSVISGNSAYLGAGIMSGGILQITDSTISENMAVEGGGILIWGGDLKLSNVTVINNSAEFAGGGVVSQGIASISNSTFKGNTAGEIGGGTYAGHLTITNSTFAGNSAASAGGGLWSWGPLTVINSTISGNSSSTGGGGIHSTGRLNLTNTILANSTAGKDCYNEGGAIGTNVNNLIEVNAAVPNKCGTPASTADPALGPLANNGGPTQTMALLSGSPAIDAGNDASCPAADQRGVKRPQGSHCDLGAYELDNIAPAVTGVTSSVQDRAYHIGETIPVTVTFDETVIVSGAPQLTLETGSVDRVASYSSGSSTDILAFLYIVQAGDVSADLDYVSTAALALIGGTIKDAWGSNAVLTLPAPGAAHSLGASKNIVVDGIAPVLVSFTRQNPATSPTIASTLVFRATFSEVVLHVDASDFAVSGTTATVTNVAAVNTGIYDVTVSGGNLSNFNGVVGLNLSGSQDIKDQAGNVLPTNEPATDETYVVNNIQQPLPGGWVGGVSIISNKNIVTVGRPHVGAEVASYDGFPSGSLTSYVPMLFRKAYGGSYNSALYVQNVHASSTANITIKYYDDAGNLKCTKNDSIAALSSKGYWLPTETCNTGSLLDGWVGGAFVTSDQPIVAVGRPHVGSEVMTYDGFPSGSLTSYIPMLFKGAYGSYNSAFYVQNVNDSNPANITIKYYDSNGELKCTKADTINPLASKGYWVPTATCDTGSIPPGWVGGVVVTSNQPIVGVGRPHIGTQVTTYNGFTSGATSSYIPMLFRNAWGSYNSAFYLQNTTGSDAHVTIQYYSDTGVLNCTKADTIKPLASNGYWVPSATCDSGSLPDGWVGGVVVSSDQPVVGVGRPHIGEQVTTYNGFTAGSLNSYLPMLFKETWGTYNSAFYIQNTENTAATVTVKFYNTNGQLSCTKTDTIPALSTQGYWLPSVTCSP